MGNFTKSLVFLVFAVPFCLAVDYCKFNKHCNSSSAGHYPKHIACNNDGRIHCQGGKVIPITEKVKQVILDTHNQLRNRIASGNQPGFRSASRMGTVTWDNELASLAVLNVKQCKMEHDCHETENYPLSGQNIAYSDDTEQSTEQFAKERIESWFNEYKNMNNNLIQYYVFKMNNGHFAALVKENNHKIGCAILKSGKKRFLTCNYASGLISGRTLYKFGKGGSECKSGRNSEYSALCSVSEKYTYNEQLV